MKNVLRKCTRKVSDGEYRHLIFFYKKRPVQRTLKLLGNFSILNRQDCVLYSEILFFRGNPERTANRPPPPSKIRITKGSVHILASRGFVDYMINNETAIKFLAWVKTTIIPDETFFSTLNYNPHLKVPGSYLG